MSQPVSINCKTPDVEIEEEVREAKLPTQGNDDSLVSREKLEEKSQPVRLGILAQSLAKGFKNPRAEANRRTDKKPVPEFKCFKKTINFKLKLHRNGVKTEPKNIEI